MAAGTGSGSDAKKVEARIAWALSSLAIRPPSDGRPAPPPAYVRRHLAEHAVAGECLNEDIFPARLIPFIDISRFREGTVKSAQGSSAGPGSPARAATHSASWARLLAVVRQVSHTWDWGDPYRNAAALQLWAAAGRVPTPGLDALSAWRIPWARFPGQSEIIGRVGSPVTCVATGVQQDGDDVAATGSRDGTLSLWNLATGSVIASAAQRAAIRSVAIVSRPGAPLAAVTGSADGTLRLWRSPAGPAREPVLVAQARGGEGVTALAMAPTARGPVALIGRQDGSLRIWDLRSETLIRWSAGHGDHVTGIATATLAGGVPVAVTVRLDGSLQLWELDADRTVPRAVSRPLPGHQQAIRAVATTALPDHRVVAVTGGDDGFARIWDLAQRCAPVGEPVIAHGGHPVTAVAAWTLPGKAYAMTVGRDQSMQAWTLPDGVLAGEPFMADGLEITAAAVAHGALDMAVTGCGDLTLQAWDLAPMLAAAQARRRPKTPSATVRDRLRTWSLDDGQPLSAAVASDVSNAIGVAIGTLPDGRNVIVTGHEHRPGLPAGDLPPRGGIGPQDDQEEGLLTALCVPGQRALAVSGHGDGMLRTWDIAGLTAAAGPLAAHAGPVTALAACRAADMTLVVSGGTDRIVRVWDLTDLYRAPDGDAPRSQRTIVGRQLHRPGWRDSSDGPVSAVAATCWGDRPVAVSASNTIVQLWDLVECEPFGAPMGLLTHPVTALAVADVAGLIIGVLGSERDGDAHVWDLQSERHIGTLAGHERPLTAVAIADTHDGSAVAFTASSDHTVRAWDVANCRQVGETLPLPGVPKALVAISDGDGPGVIVAGSGMLAVLRLPLT